MLTAFICDSICWSRNLNVQSHVTGLVCPEEVSKKFDVLRPVNHDSYIRAICLEETLCGWQDVKFWLLANYQSYFPHVCVTVSLRHSQSQLEGGTAPLPLTNRSWVECVCSSSPVQLTDRVTVVWQGYSGMTGLQWYDRVTVVWQSYSSSMTELQWYEVMTKWQSCMAVLFWLASVSLCNA